MQENIIGMAYHACHAWHQRSLGVGIHILLANFATGYSRKGMNISLVQQGDPRPVATGTTGHGWVVKADIRSRMMDSIPTNAACSCWIQCIMSCRRQMAGRQAGSLSQGYIQRFKHLANDHSNAVEIEVEIEVAHDSVA